MNFIKRAGLYTIRQKTKTILLLFVLILIATLILTGIAIRSAIGNTSDNLQGNLAGMINLERVVPTLDHDSRMAAHEEGGIEALNRLTNELFQSGDFLTFELLNEITAIPGIASYNINGEFMMRDVATYNFNFMNVIESGMVNMYGMVEQTYTATIHSASNSQNMTGFLNGNLRLTAGRHLSPDDKRSVLISDELAEDNNLQVGDTLKISGAPTFMGDGVEPASFEFEIVGIFSGTRLAEADEQAGHVTERRNLDSDALIIDINTMMEEYARTHYFGSGATGSLPGTLSIFIENPNDIDVVYDVLTNHPSIYGKTFSLTRGSDGFEDVLSSMSSLSLLINTLIIIIALVSMAILGILLTIWTRGRIKEIGIYLANGIKKSEILSQFIFEAFVIAVVAFAVALPISGLVAEGTGDFILSQFKQTQALRAEQLAGSVFEVTQGGTMIITPETGFLETADIENTLDLVEIGVSSGDLIWVYVIGLPVVIVSVLIASYSVVKLKPKEILTKMS